MNTSRSVNVRERRELLAPLDLPGDDPERALPVLESLEIHSGMVFGSRRSASPAAPAATTTSGVRNVLEEILVPAVSSSPCLVAFSGGRDSSTILALTTEVARRHGFEDPVPITLRYDAHPRTWEGEWQERVVRHLGLRDWQILPVAEEFDILGPIARQALLRHGLYWPANAHTMVPLLRAAGGGTLITGNGGDEAFTSLVRSRKMSPLQMMRSLPLHRALATIPVSFLPTEWRIRVQYHRGLRFPWLRPAARREVRKRFVDASIRRRRGDRHYLETLNDSRYLELARGIFTAFARDAGSALVEPFLDPRFFEAARSAALPHGFPDRGAALDNFFSGLLPDSVVRRSTKASFTEVFWGPRSRRFASGWDGAGLDESLVDPDALRREWAKRKPDFRSATPLQASWLASDDRYSEGESRVATGPAGP